MFAAEDPAMKAQSVKCLKLSVLVAAAVFVLVLAACSTFKVPAETTKTILAFTGAAAGLGVGILAFINSWRS